MSRGEVWRGIWATVAFAAFAGLAGCVIVVDGDGDDHDAHEWRESRRNYIGVTTDTISRETAAQLALDRDLVALITYVYAGTPADRAGLQRYDVVTSIDGEPPASPSRLRAVIRSRKPGEEIRLGIVRGGKPTEVVVVIGEN